MSDLKKYEGVIQYACYDDQGEVSPEGMCLGSILH